MVSVDIYKMNGDKSGTFELDDDLFGIEDVNEGAVHAAVVAYLANQRQGTRKTLTRREVRGGGIKPRPQKGTGRSRQGSIRSPQWKGGGMAFAIRPQDWHMKVNKKVKRLALKSVLTTKAKDSNVVVLEDLRFDDVKTKSMVGVLKALNLSNALFVLPEADRNVVLSARNIQGIQTAHVNTINVYDILKYDKFVMTKAAAEKISEVYR